MAQYDTLADNATIEATVRALEANGFTVTVAEDAEAGKAAVLDLLPKGAQVLSVTSQTAVALGLDEIINESGDYDSVRVKLNALASDPSKKREQRQLGSAPDYVVGSVHALTQDGHALIASGTGSQLPAYVYGAEHVVWAVSTKKIVKDLTAAWDRLETYVFPLEDARAKVAYGFGSNIRKVLTYNREATPGRVHIVLIKADLGF